MKSFKKLMSEVAQPKSEDEQNYKDKHEIEVIDHLEAEESQFTSDKQVKRRIADYGEGEDEDVYESKVIYKTSADDRDELDDIYHDLKQKYPKNKITTTRNKAIGGWDIEVLKEATTLDPVDKTEIGKKFKKRSDKDIDNDGDVDDSDKYLHKRRKAISKAMKKDVTEGYRVVATSKDGESFKSGLYSSKKEAEAMHWKMAKGNKYKDVQTVKEGVELQEATGNDFVDALISAIEKNAKKSEFQKASQAFEDWGNKNKRSFENLTNGAGVAGAFFADLQEVLDVRVGTNETVDEDTADFITKAAAAKKKDKKKFELDGEEYPVTIKDKNVKKVMEMIHRHQQSLGEAVQVKKNGPNTWNIIKDGKTIGSIDKGSMLGGGYSVKIGGSSLKHEIAHETSLKAAKEAIKYELGESNSVALTETFSAGSIKLDDGSKVTINKKDADTLNQMFDDLNAKNQKEMKKVAMADKSSFDELLDFAKEAL